MQFPQIDRNLAQRQLALLGYSVNDPIYLRFFYPSDDPRKDGDAGRKADQVNWDQIENYQGEGRGAYFVVNGGGHKNDDVTQGRAIFVEHDDLPKDIQRNLWKTLGLPEPTFQVDTGGKSIHAYWVFNSAVEIEKWCQLQRDLLEYADGDRSIKNPARVMRLAGGWHISHDSDGNPIYNQTKIISASAKMYSYEELRGMIPNKETSGQGEKGDLEDKVDKGDRRFHAQKSPHSPVSPPSSVSPVSSDTIRHPDFISVPVQAAVPLLQCCRKEVREWVATGVPKGCQRNDTSINVALELIAVERYLQTIGQSYTDSAVSLFHEFCQSSGMTASEEEERFQWSSKTNAAPSCPPDAIAACIKGWYWKEVIKPQQQSNQGTVGINTNNQAVTGEKEKETQDKPKINILDTVKQILRKFPKDSLRQIALMDLSNQTGYRTRDLELLVRTIEHEETLDEETAVAIASFSTNLNLHSTRLDIGKYLESNFAALMVDAANAMPTAPEYLFNTLLATVASCGGTSPNIVANPGGGYVQPLIMWTGNVAHSGQAKTPPQQIIVQPLLDLEEEAAKKYELERKQYEQDKSGNVEPPIRKRYVLSNTTLSTKIRIHGENEDGFLEYADELASDYRRLNQFKKGQGDDKEQELSLFNGGHISYDRSDIRLFLRETAISKTGSIQWATLAQLMSDPSFIESGYMARFLLCSIGDAPPRRLNLLSENNAVQKLQQSLRWLYEQMMELPSQDYLLDYDAKVLFQAWNHTLVDANRRESNFGFSLVYAKIETYTLRLALWLHLVNSLLRGEKPELIVNGQTMKSAIEIASFYLGQQKLIWAHNDPHNQLEGILLKIHTSAVEFYQETKKGVSASWAKQKFNALKKIAAAKIRLQYFQVLASCGYGELTGEGKSMLYIPYQERLVINGLNESQKVGENSVLGEKLVEAPSPISNIQSVFEQKVGEVDDSTYHSIFLEQSETLESEKTHSAKSFEQEDKGTKGQGDKGTLEDKGEFYGESPLSLISISPLSSSSSVSPVSSISPIFPVFPLSYLTENICYSTEKAPQQSILNNQPPAISNSQSIEGVHEQQGNLDSSCLNEPIKDHQFTNKSDSKLDATSIVEVGGQHQPHHQSPTFDPPDFQGDIQWLIKLLEDLEQDNSSLTSDEWLELISQAEEKINTIDGFLEQYPDYWEKIWLTHPSCCGVPPQPPSLDELKVLLLACQTWVEVKNLNQQHPETKKAYTALTPDEQNQVDAVAATEVNHDVYKYVGPQRKVDGVDIAPGTLVYLDPHSSNKNRFHLKVRLLQGINQNWQKVVEISRELLEAVEKAVNDGLDAVEVHQGNLLDGLS